MDDERIKQEKLRKKAEEVVKTQSDHAKNESWNLDEVIYDLRVHQVELEMQNEELRKAQTELEDSRRKYFDLYNFAPVGYFTLDRKGIILDVNLTGASLLGVKRLTLQKQAFIQYIFPECRNIFHHHLNKVIETGNKQSVELKLLKNDNSSFYGHFETLNVQNENEKFKEFRIAVMDISVQKKAEIAHHTSEKLFKLMFNRSPLASAITSLDYTPLQINDAFSHMIGYPKEELLSTKFPEYTHPNDLLEEIKQLNRIISGEIDNFVMEKKYIHKNGEILNGNLFISAVKDQTNKLVNFLIIVENITERKKMEKLVNQRADKLANINKLLNVEINDHEKAEIKLDKLIERYKSSNRDLEQFAYVSSHDLKEPLRMIISFLQLLKKRYADDLDEDANEFIGFAVDGAKRMEMLINDLLEYSQIGSKERKYEYIKSEEILKHVLITLNQPIITNNAVITHDPLPVIYANDNMMEQLFQNLIGNAIKYHGAKYPKIHISADNIDDDFVFSIKDNGIGIDQKHLDRIFTIFQRLHSREEYEGTGIGLANAKKILEKHRGKIWVESEPGKGSTFYFSIPNKNY